MHMHAITGSLTLKKFQENRPFSRSHCRNLEITQISRNKLQMDIFVDTIIA